MIRSLIIIAALLFVFSSSSFAQSGLQLGLRFNPEFTGIANSNDAAASPELEKTSHFGYLSFGIGALYNIDRNIGVGVDILFSREGQAFTGTFAGGEAEHQDAYSAVIATQLKQNSLPVKGDFEALAELNYIKVPVMFSWATDNTAPIYFSILVGPQFNFLHGIALEVNGEDLEFPKSNFTPDVLYNSMTIGGVLAFGAGFNVSSNMVLTARLRFDYGFGDAENKEVLVSLKNDNKFEPFYPTTRSSAHSESAGLMIGLDFKL